MKQLVWSGLVLAVMSLGCFGSDDEPEKEKRETISAADYDQSCMINADCVQVQEGSLCAACGCSNAAINGKDKTKFDAYAAGRTCETPSDVVCGACQETQAICEASKCAVAPRVHFSASSYKTTCAVKEDCVGVYVGEGCAACKCENGAIHKDDLAKYQEDRASARCGATGIACAADCAQVEVDCVEGMCQAP